MGVVFSNGVQYSIEFIKLILVVACILNIHVKKSINVIFGLSLLGIMAVSYWFDISEYSILYALVAIIIFLVTLYEKKNIGFVILSFVAISIVDMLAGTVCIIVLGLTMEQIQDNYMLVSVMNSLSFIPIIVLSIVIQKRNNANKHRLNTYMPIILLGGLALSFYLTCTQLVNLEKMYINYQNGLLISAIVITLVFSAISYLLTRNQVKNSYLKMENDMNQRLLKAQNDYYSMKLKKDTETKMFRHDIKQHIMCIQMLYAQKKYDELGEYLKQMDAYTKDLSPKITTGNMYIDIIVADLSEEFPAVTVEWIGKVPLLSIASMDVCTLFYNMLKNAFEAANIVSDKTVKVIIKKQGMNLMVLVSNRYENLKQDENFRYLSTKQEEGHGYGIKNIEKCVEKYGGSYIVTTENQCFNTEIILSNVIKEE